MVPSYNHWESRKIVDISMKCKIGKLTLDVPLMTSNMDTITEANMANFIGAKDGIGVLHRYMSIINKRVIPSIEILNAHYRLKKDPEFIS